MIVPKNPLFVKQSVFLYNYFMKIIAGLGNPEDKYLHTRHNAGFLALDFYMKDLNVINCSSKFKAQICELQENGEKIFFIKPQTFMNLSGTAVKEICDFYKIDASKDLLVIHDEKDLPLGQIKTTPSSSGAGHNGVQNIIEELGTQDFNRIRIGIESREEGSPVPTDVFVLQRFTDEELEMLDSKIFSEVKEKIAEFLKQ